jgi:hypothetical protein
MNYILGNHWALPILMCRAVVMCVGVCVCGGGGGTDGRKGLQTRQPVGAILIDVRSSGAAEREEGTADTTTHGLLPSRCVG